MRESLAKFLADCRSKAPLAAQFFEEAADLAKSMRYLVGRGNTSDRRYYVVRVKKNCGFVSFCYPNELEIYFHRLFREGYLDGGKKLVSINGYKKKDFVPVILTTIGRRITFSW